MRISDWSSDVCSSDLLWAFLNPSLRGASRSNPARWIATSGCAGLAMTRHFNLLPRSQLHPLPAELQRVAVKLLVGRDGVDRKSVVEGKSVSVRVDLGGGRIIKTKNYQLQHHGT